MLISGVPLQIRVVQSNNSYVDYTSVASVPDANIRIKIQRIMDSVIKVSKITIKVS
jgi:hypothetical protein